MKNSKSTRYSYSILINLELDLDNLKTLLDNNKVIDVKNSFREIIKLYKSNSEIVDHIYTLNN